MPGLDDGQALHLQIVQVIESCMPFMQAAMYNRIVVSGTAL